MERKTDTRIFRTTLLTSFALCIGLVACNSETKNQDQNDSKAVAEEHNDAKFEDKAKEKEAQFLVDAAEMSLEEISLSKLAQSNAKAADIKDLAKMMEEDHSKALKELEALAAKKMITVPTEMTKDATESYDKLKNKTGDDFDSEYCKMMVDAHKDAVEKFEKASTDAEDYEIKTWAAKMLPSLRAHLDHAMTCDAKYKHDDDQKNKKSDLKKGRFY